MHITQWLSIRTGQLWQGSPRSHYTAEVRWCSKRSDRTGNCWFTVAEEFQVLPSAWEAGGGLEIQGGMAVSMNRGRGVVFCPGHISLCKPSSYTVAGEEASDLDRTLVTAYKHHDNNSYDLCIENAPCFFFLIFETQFSDFTSISHRSIYIWIHLCTRQFCVYIYNIDGSWLQWVVGGGTWMRLVVVGRPIRLVCCNISS